MNCDYCAGMQRLALPDHRTEMYFEARDESWRYHGGDIGFVDGVLAEFDTLPEHRFPLAPWSMRAFVRRHTLARLGVATMREAEALLERNVT